MKGQKLIPIAVAMVLITSGAAMAQPSQLINVSDEILERGAKAQTARGKGGEAITASDDVLERGTRAQAARGKGPATINASDDVLERGTRAQAARGKGGKTITASDDVLERGTRAQAARGKGSKAISVSDDVLERGNRAQAARGKSAKALSVSDDVLERGNRAQAARGKAVVGASDDVARNKNVLSASDDVIAGTSKSSGGMAKGAAKGAAGGAALYLGVDVAVHAAEGGDLRDYEVDKKELAVQVAVSAAGPAGGGVYAAYKIFEQEKNDPGKTWRDIKSGNINISATDAVMMGGVTGLAAWGTYKFLEQELSEPGKTRDDAYLYVEQATGTQLSEQDKENIDTALMFYVPGYAVYKLAVQEANQPGKTREDAYALVENELGIPLTAIEKEHIAVALRSVVPSYSIFDASPDKSENYLLSPEPIFKAEVNKYASFVDFSADLNARAVAWQRVAFVETAERIQPADMDWLFAPVPEVQQQTVTSLGGAITSVKVDGALAGMSSAAADTGHGVLQRAHTVGRGASSWGKAAVSDGAAAAGRGFDEVASGARQTFRDVGGQLQPAAHQIGQGIGRAGRQIGGFAEGAAGSVGSTIGSAAHQVGQGAHQVGSAINSGASGAIDKVDSTGKKAADKVKDQVGDAADKIGGFLR